MGDRAPAGRSTPLLFDLVTVSEPLPSKRAWALLLVAVLLVASNLRLTIMGVGPLLELIAEDEGVPLASLGALASVPLVAWAIVSPLTHGISARLGTSRTVTWALVVMLIGTLWRSLPGSAANLWLGTALVGVGIAIGNVLLPALVKRDFSRHLSLIMGSYTALLSGLAAVGAGIAVPIAHTTVGGSELGWRIALLATGALLPVTLVVWILATRGSDAVRHPDAPRLEIDARSIGAGRRIWRDPMAWGIATYMGAQSVVYYVISTWLAPLSTSLGRSPVVAGIDVMVFQLTAIAGSMCFPLLHRWVPGRVLPVLLPAIACATSTGILLAPGALPLWYSVAGFTSGATLSLTMTLTATRAHDHLVATALSGMSQSVGYLIAAVGPILFGALRAAAGNWTAPLVMLIATSVVQLSIGLYVGRGDAVLSQPSRRERGASDPAAEG